MLTKAPELIEGLIEIAYQRKWLFATFATIEVSKLHCIEIALECMECHHKLIDFDISYNFTFY
jgi:hypothetical protein